MRNVVIALAESGAHGAGDRLVADGASREEVVAAVAHEAKHCYMAPTEDEAFVAFVAALMRLYPDDEAKHCYMAPTEDEAFVAFVAALMRLYPDDRDLLEAEAKSIGDANRLLQAAVSGIPIDWEKVEPVVPPEGAWGLVRLFRDAS